MSEKTPSPHIMQSADTPVSPENIGSDTIVHELESDQIVRDLVLDQLDGHEPDALFPFSAGIKQSEATGQWRTLAYADVGEHGLVTGSRTRVIAGAKIAEVFPEVPIVTNSFNRFDESEPTMASVVKNELIKRKINPERISLEESSFSTITQLTEMVKLANQNKWKNVVAITNTFHFPRTSEMVKQLDVIIEDDEFQESLQTFKDNGGRIGLVSAEDVMRSMNPHYGNYLDAAMETPEYAATVAAEANGLRDLKKGQYRVTLNPEKPR